MKKVAVPLIFIAAFRVLISLALFLFITYDANPELKYGVDFKDKVQVVSIDKNQNPTVLKYADTKYVIDNEGYFDFFDYDKYDSGYPDVFLSWSDTEDEVEYYYSDTTENPLYIYDDYSNIYISSDYDYENDIFTVDGTDVTIEFEELTSGTLIDRDVDVYFYDTQAVKLCTSKSDSLYMYLVILDYKGTFYGQIGLSDYTVLPADFVIELIEADAVYFASPAPPGNII